MRNSREAIYQACFDQAVTAGPFVTASRRTRIFSDIPAEMQPALFMEQVGENPERPGGSMPYRWIIEVVFAIYCYDGDPDAVPSSALNQYLDALELVFPSSPLFPPQTLGGLVVEARLQGDGKSFQGSLGNQAWAYVPVRMISV